MNLPIPEVSDFFAGFASCAALTVAVVAFAHVKTSWPAIKATAGTIEQKAAAEFKAGIDAAHAKIDQLSNAAASAINAIRGDVKTFRAELSSVQARVAAIEGDVLARVAALEKAVGITPPAPVDHPAVGVSVSPAASAPDLTLHNVV